MKRMLKTILVLVIILLVTIPASVSGLLYLNGRVGVETDFRQSSFLAAKPEPLSDVLTVKAVTFNIQDLWIVGRNRPERMRHIARVLTDLDPDIVGFQEAFIKEDRAELLQALDSSRLIHHHYYPSGLGGSGLLICSVWPIREVFFHRFSVSGPARRLWEGDYWAGKGVALARIETHAGMLDFYNTHAQAGYGRASYRELRRVQMTELAAFINQSRTGTSPVFLVGDMNCGVGKVDYETVVEQAGLKRAMALDTRIDHIFVTDDKHHTHEILETVPIKERVTEGASTFNLSDHIGYMSTIRLVPARDVQSAESGAV